MTERQKWIPLWEEWPDEDEVVVKIVLTDNSFVNRHAPFKCANCGTLFAVRVQMAFEVVEVETQSST